VEHERFEAAPAEHLGDDIEVFGPSREHQAVPAGVDRGGDVVADRPGAVGVFDEAAVDRLDVLAACRPSAIRNAAQVCRRLWKCSPAGSPASRTAGLKWRR
jgi:hypothetical protein